MYLFHCKIFYIKEIVIVIVSIIHSVLKVSLLSKWHADSKFIAGYYNPGLCSLIRSIVTVL